MRRKTIALLLCVFTPFFLGACRSRPISTPQTTGIEEVEPTKTDVPLESAKLPETGVDTALKQNKEIIPRLLPESLIGAPTKETVSRRVEYNTTINSRSSDPSRKVAWQYRMGIAAGAVDTDHRAQLFRFGVDRIVKCAAQRHRQAHR